jgi:hypothetical protein
MSFEPYKGEVNLKIYQVEFDGEFSHWQFDLSVGGDVISQGTSPTFFGCMDFDVFFPDIDHNPEDLLDMKYFEMDANKRNYK